MNSGTVGVRSGGSALVDVHWYAGEIYNGLPGTASTIETTIATPNHAPTPTDFYYVILSIFDTAKSYDQIGFASDGDHWGLAWSWSDPCPTEDHDYHFDSDALRLEQGHSYTFRMAWQNGALVYSAFAEGVRIWISAPVQTGGSGFVVTPYITCGWSIIPNLTNYEEVWDIGPDQMAPEWSFHFWGTKIDSGSADFWSIHFSGGPPSQVWPVIDGARLIIANQYFELSMNDGNNVRVPSGFTWVPLIGQVTWLYNPWGCLLKDCHVDLQIMQKPAAWQIVIIPNRGFPTFIFGLYLTIPPNEILGPHVVELRAKNAPRSEWTTYMITITIKGRGGAGCVAQGTQVLTPMGYVFVQNLATNDQVIGYNLSSGSFVTSTLSAIHVSLEEWTVSINNGYLRVTLVDQPLYYRNETFAGWLNDPQDVSAGDLLYNPMDDSWIIVHDIHFVNESISVYSLVPSDPGNFISSGVLLGNKVPN